MNQYFVYIMTNRSKTLYTGVTNDLERRVYEHKQKLVEGFTKNYSINMLVHFEVTDNAESAITREKQIKSWRRNRKIAFIEDTNPNWEDLSENWYRNKGDPSSA